MANNNPMAVGVRFSPTDEELLEIFLPQRENLNPIYPINTVDVYGENEPWLIFDKLVKQIHYVFVKLKRKTTNGAMIKRTAGCGTWSGQTPGKPISDDQGRVLGFKKLLTFETPNGDDGDNGRWIMHEYSMARDDSDYVICAIRNKKLDVNPAVNAPKKRVLKRGKNAKNASNVVQSDLTNQGAISKASEIGNQQELNVCLAMQDSEVAGGAEEREILNRKYGQDMESYGGVIDGYSCPQEASSMQSIIKLTSEDIDKARNSDGIHVQESIGAVISTLQTGEDPASNQNEDIMLNSTFDSRFDNFEELSLDIATQHYMAISNTAWFENEDNFISIDDLLGPDDTSSNQRFEEVVNNFQQD